MKRFFLIIIVLSFCVTSFSQTQEKTNSTPAKPTKIKPTTNSKDKSSNIKSKKIEKEKKKTNPKPKEEVKIDPKVEKENKDCQEANEKLQEAHKQIEDKQYWLAEQRLKEALALCSKEELKFKYELAWNYYLMKEYKRTIDVLDTLSKQKDAPSDVFQLLGNAYDELGNEAMALIIYDKGFEKYPNAGCLFLERGNLAYKHSNFKRALEYYEKGIEQDPLFSSNYYRAAQIFLSSSEEVWGMIYGEIFMNLERGGERAIEMSKKLFDTYHSEITFNVNNIRVNFNDPTIIYSDSKERPNLFPDNYESALLRACQGRNNITLQSLIEIRRRFVQVFNAQYPSFRNVLFDYQKKLIDMGYFDAYNYWLFGYGNTQEAAIWIAKNKVIFDKFISWQQENPFPINKDNVFSRYKME